MKEAFGGTPTPAFAGSLSAQQRSERVRLIGQMLLDLGLLTTRAALEAEAGVPLESAAAAALRERVLGGAWAQLPPSGAVAEQKFLELLELRRAKDALRVLRAEIAPRCSDHARLSSLASLIMCTSVEDLKRKADWDGALGQSRSRLLAKLQKTMQIDSDSAIIPEHRLESIFSQAIEYQQQHCLYHNVPNSNISLLSDHSCDRSSFPTKTQYILDGHSDEVWFVAFSANGKFLASASKDRTCIIWDTESYKPIHVLRGHSDHVSVVAWSPDSLFILTGSNDNSIKLWDVHTGANVRTFSLHSETITSLAFLPTIPASSFVSSSVDKNVFLWSVEGHVLHKWNGVRVTDLNVTADGSRMVTISDKRIRVFDLATKDEILTLQEQDAITSINTASDCRYTLVNVAASQEIHLWDMQEKRVAKTFVGHKQGRFVIRSCFGGLFQSFVLSGSEDSKIYVWNREQSVLLESLEGHRATVNSISWSPNQNIFASASDDCTIRIWAADSHE